MKRFSDKKASFVLGITTVSCASLIAVGCIGFGIASAGVDTTQDTSTIGLTTVSKATQHTTVAENDSFVGTSSDYVRESTVLTSTAPRDISQGIEALEAEEEAARIAAEEAKRVEEEAHIQAAEEAQAKQTASGSVSSLSEVDFSVGEEAFITEWTTRIDAYLAGSPLAGQGATFARAAWTYGVDPRWSPAISNTESSKGMYCFKPHNAWGWGQSSWSSWEEAINAHVSGLASGYGYSITYSAAKKYCPPSYDHWFNSTLSQMKMI